MNQKFISLAWAYLRCKDKHFFTLHKTFQEFYFNLFHPPTQHTLTVCPNQQQPSSNLHRRKPTFSTPTHNVYSPGQAKRSSLSGISAQFNQPASFYYQLTQKKSNSSPSCSFSISITIKLLTVDFITRVHVLHKNHRECRF